MRKFLSFNNILIVSFFSLFFIYLHEQMVIDALRGLSNVGSKIAPLCNIGMVLVIVVYAIINKSKQFNYDGFPYYFSKILIATGAISLMWSLFNPFGTLNTYILLLLPALVPWFSFRISSSKDSNLIIMICLILGLLYLTKTFFDYISYRIFLGARDTSQVNIAYYLMYLTPLFLCAKSKTFRLSAIVLIMATVLTSAKRGGTIAMSLGIVAYLFTKFVLVKSNGKVLRNLLICIPIAIIVGIVLVDYLASSDLVVVERLIATVENKGEETRMDIWILVLDMILSSNIIELVLGHGYNSVLTNNPLGFSAHNDFLEVAYDFGVFAFIAFLILFIRIFKFCKELIANHSKYAGAMVFSFCLLCIDSLVSHIYIYPFYAMEFGLVWGVIYGLYKKEQLLNIK